MIWLTLFFKEEMIWGREDVVLHQILRRILVPLLLRTVGQSTRIQFDNHELLLQQPMVLEQYMLVLLVHHLLLFVLELSINNNKLLRNGKCYNRIGFTNQYHV
jgi:hypothetical protein